MRRHDGIARDERGAMMVICVFFAVFAVSMLYLAIGAGETVLFREHLQDAADSAALSGAITHARMMNLLVLINLVMAALLAILVAIKAVEGLALIGIAIAIGLAFLTGGATLVAVPPLKVLQINMHELYETMEPPVFQALSLLNDASTEFAAIASEASDMVVEDEAAERDAPGFAAAAASKLPVEDNKYEQLCEKAGQMALTMALLPLEDLGLPSKVRGALEGPAGELTRSLSNWFCGDGENSMPDLGQYVDLGYPRPDGADECEQSLQLPENRIPLGQEKSASARLTGPCREVEERTKSAEPDREGKCRKEEDCSPTGPYEQAAAKARPDCDPSVEPRPTNYRYQVQGKRVEYSWNGRRWVRGVPEERFSRMSGDGASAPCGPRHLWPSVAEGYNLVVHPEDDPNQVLPVCTTEQEPPPPVIDLLHGKAEEVQPVTVDFEQVTHIFSCLRHQKVKVPVGESKSPGKGGSNAKSPKQVKEGVTLGSEPFQLRSIMLGNAEQRDSERLVRLGLWDKSDPEDPIEGLRELGGFAIAQAEYFYGEADEPAAWMWNMKWRARLKRFALPENADTAAALRTKCLAASIPNERCSQILGAIEDWNDLILH